MTFDYLMAEGAREWAADYSELLAADYFLVTRMVTLLAASVALLTLLIGRLVIG